MAYSGLFIFPDPFVFFGLVALFGTGVISRRSGAATPARDIPRAMREVERRASFSMTFIRSQYVRWFQGWGGKSLLIQGKTRVTGSRRRR